MPQLDPAPWFLIMFTAWAIFIALSPTKIPNYNHLNDPTLKLFKSLSNSWLWPWS